MKIGLTLQMLRTRAGMSQVQLAKKSKLSQAMIACIENDVKSPSTNTLEKLFKALKVKASYFFLKVEEGFK